MEDVLAEIINLASEATPNVLKITTALAALAVEVSTLHATLNASLASGTSVGASTPHSGSAGSLVAGTDADSGSDNNVGG